MSAQRLALLEARHDVEAFSCGEPGLDAYLRNEARKSQAAGETQTHVWEGDDGRKILAYFTLMPTAVVEAEHVGRKKPKGKAEDPYPVVLIAKLALCEELRGQRLGNDLIQDVLAVIVKAADLIGGRFIIVDAMNNAVFARYESWDFQPVSGEYRLWMKVATARAALAPSTDTGALTAVGES